MLRFWGILGFGRGIPPSGLCKTLPETRFWKPQDRRNAIELIDLRSQCLKTFLRREDLENNRLRLRRKIFNSSYYLASPLSYGLMHVIKIIEFEDKTTIDFYSCIYSISVFCNAEKLAGRIAGIGLGRVLPMPPIITCPLCQLHTRPCSS